MIPLTIQDQFYTLQNLQRSPIPQTSNWSGTFFAVSYSKLALELIFLPSVSGGGSTFNNIFDDSEDDDLLDATESPSSKQESAVFSALKTMVLFGGAMIASAVILGKIFLISAQYFYNVKNG